MQVKQIIHSKYMAQIQLMFFQPCRILFQRESLFLQFNSLIHQQSFAQGCTQRINHYDFPFRIFFLQFFCCQPHTVVGSTESGGKSQIQNIFSLLQNRTQNFFCLLRIHLRSGRHRAIPHPCIKIRKFQFLILSIGLTIHRVGQIGILHTMFFII